MASGSDSYNHKAESDSFVDAFNNTVKESNLRRIAREGEQRKKQGLPVNTEQIRAIGEVYRLDHPQDYESGQR